MRAAAAAVSTVLVAACRRLPRSGRLSLRVPRAVRTERILRGGRPLQPAGRGRGLSVAAAVRASGRTGGRYLRPRLLRRRSHQPAFALGSAHACLVRAGGRVQCWGRNDDGQLGDGTRTARSLPVNVASLTAASGGGHGPAPQLRDSGRPIARSSAGAPTTSGSSATAAAPRGSAPVEVAGVNGAVAVAAGADFSCAALASGTVTCWGDASVGQLGDGRFAPGPHPPVTVTPWQGRRCCPLFPNTPAPSGATACSCAGARTPKVSSATAPPRTAPSPAPSMGFPTSAAVGTGVSHTCALAAAGFSAGAAMPPVSSATGAATARP